jgi:hypothetical protein
MTTYYCNDGNAELEIEAESAQDAAQEYVDGGDWGEGEKTTWVSVCVTPRCVMCEGSGEDENAADDATDEEKECVSCDGTGRIEADREYITITIEPDEPSCTDSRGDDHDWQSPIELVGGIKENPGVFGHGGGVRIHEVCIYCGTERVTDTWAQNPANGEQGLNSVEYEEGKYADEVAPEYRYEVTESVNAGHALITVDAYVLGEKVAGAMFDVDSEGELECDTQSDGCESNPFDDDGWPAPDPSLIDEAVELASAGQGV